MMKHLRTQHQKDINEQEEMAKQMTQKHTLSDFVFVTVPKNKPDSSNSIASSSGTANSYLQKTLQETYELKKIWDINSTQAKKIHFAISEMIAVDSHQNQKKNE